MTPILGIDVSKWNWPRGIPPSQYPRLESAGVRFVIGRASVGHEVDTSFVNNVERTTNRGWVAGAYHFLEHGEGKGQADLFVKRCRVAWGDHQCDGLLMALDVELTSRNHVDWQDVREFVARFRILMPRHPLGIYSNRGSWLALGSHDAAQWFDWEFQALYSVHGQKPPVELPPHPPRGFGGLPAPLWQWGPLLVDGHRLDGDAFYGTGAELRKLGKVANPTPVNERPAYRAGYAESLGLVRAAIGTMSAKHDAGHPAYAVGSRAALDDADDAVAALGLTG